MSNETNRREVVAYDVAVTEVENWLKSRNLPERKIASDEVRPLIEKIADAISFGDVVIQEDGSVLQKLVEPITSKDGDVVLKELVFKPRLKYGDVRKSMQGMKTTDADGRMMAYLAASTGQPSAYFDKLEVSDFGVSTAIISFFL